MWTSNTPHAPGSRPGLLRDQASRATIRCAQYSQDQFSMGPLPGFSQLPAVGAAGESTLWIDIEGEPGLEGLTALQQLYGLHQLALEDVQNGGQSPKLEGFDHHVYMVLQLPQTRNGKVVFEQLNLFMAPGLVISIHPHEDLFEPVRLRLDSGRGIIRGAGAEYLLYALADTAVDHGFPIVQGYAEVLFDLEERAEGGDTDLSHEIYAVRRELSALLRQSHRQRDLLRDLVNPEHELLTGAHAVYWRDCLDHAERLHDNVTYLRESAADLLNTHLALISHRMNDVMKVLTIMSTVFVPLSFLVGLYGMNFNTDSPWNLPELGWRFGYLYVWGLMVCIVAGVLWFFRRRRWI